MLKKTIQISPLTTAQRGIYFGQLLDESGCAYNLVQYLDIVGAVNTEIFSKSVQRFLHLNPSLFSIINFVNDSPNLHIKPLADWRLLSHDFSHLQDP